MPVIKDFFEGPPKQRVTLKNIDREPGWTYREFVQATKRQATLGKHWLDWPGATVSFDVQTVGYKDKPLEATGWVSRAGSGERVKDLWGIVTTDGVVANTEDDSETAAIWLPTPPHKGKYRVTVAIYDQGGSRLSQLNGKPFTVRAH